MKNTILGLFRPFRPTRRSIIPCMYAAVLVWRFGVTMRYFFGGNTISFKIGFYYMPYCAVWLHLYESPNWVFKHI
uniref:Uncharacterized protein n=1 Tax=Paramoeba aparasomata TaxID=2583407 RepID=A0A5P8HBH8_9EUKA|nr:hypothetical protein [Paramoeba aparasomata]